MTWQMYWKRWWWPLFKLERKWHDYTEPYGYAIQHTYLFIGPFQCRWVSDFDDMRLK